MRERVQPAKSIERTHLHGEEYLLNSENLSRASWACYRCAAQNDPAFNRLLKNSNFCFWPPAFAGVTEKNLYVFVIPAKAGIQISTAHSLLEQLVKPPC